MKIALVCTEKLPVPPIAGGAVQLYIDGIAPFLAAKHDITIFSIQYPGLPDRETVNGIKLVRLHGGNNANYLNSLKAALDSSFDLIHVFNRPKYIVELMRILPKSRFSLSLHNEMFHPEKITDEEALLCINKVEFINTVSRYIADTVKARFPQAADKLRVVYSGVDTDAFRPAWTPQGHEAKLALKARYRLQDHKVILFVGRFSPKKGVHIMLDAVKRVMGKAPDTALLIIGSKWYGSDEIDDYTKELRTIAEQLPGPVVFTGFMPPDQVCRHYSIADVFICASQWNEPLARVHYEAMAAGLPIITTNRGGNAEVVRGFGNGIVLDDCSNAQKMAESILYLLGNPEKCIEMGRAGREMAERFFNWKRVAGEIFPESFGLQTAAGVKHKTIPVPFADTIKKAPETKFFSENQKAGAADDTASGHGAAGTAAGSTDPWNTWAAVISTNVVKTGTFAGSTDTAKTETAADGTDIVKIWTTAEDTDFAKTGTVVSSTDAVNTGTATESSDAVKTETATESSDAVGIAPALPSRDRSRFGWKRNVTISPPTRRR